jgi:hypothetical protein
MLLLILPQIAFSQVVQASGLGHAIKALHDLYGELLLKAHLEPLEEAKAATFQSFHISTRLICVLDIWRAKWSVTEPPVPLFSRCHSVGPPDATVHDAVQLMHLFEKEVIIIPAKVDLYSLFFLLSEFNFSHHWDLWILPSLKRSGTRESLLEACRLHLTDMCINT